MAATLQGPREARLDVELIDVGHGDALLLHWTPERGESSTILIDGGPVGGAPRIAESLQALGASAIDLAVLTHCDADHVDGLLTYARSADRLPVRRYWGPCVPAFRRHDWLFPTRIARGLTQTELLEQALGQNTPISWPVEGAEWASPDDGLTIKVLSPAGRLIERLLVGDDALDLFLDSPMPLGWLLSPPPDSPIEDNYADLRAAIASGEITPDRIPNLPPPEQQASAEALAAETAKRGIDPEFFGNPVLNDTSIVLMVEACIGAVRRRLLFTGDLENFTYLMAVHPMGLGCEIVKAPHHGARSYVGREEAYDAAWQWLRPRAVLVSANGKHRLPRQDFRNAALRYGATLFCTCRRSLEVVSGPLDKVSCHDQFACDQQAPVSIALTEHGTIAKGVACARGSQYGTVPVIELRQHVVEPSSILESFGEGEIRRHASWIVETLRRMHETRVKAGGEAGIEAVPASLLRREALADGRYRAAANIEVVLERAARDGKIWLSRGDRYGNTKRKAWILPSPSELRTLEAWISGYVVVQLAIRHRTGAMVPRELLMEGDTGDLARRAAERTAFPEEMFADTIWPLLVRHLLKNRRLAAREVPNDSRVSTIVALFSEATPKDACAALRAKLEATNAGAAIVDYMLMATANQRTYSQSATTWPAALNDAVSQLRSDETTLPVSAHLNSPNGNLTERMRIAPLASAEAVDAFMAWRSNSWRPALPEAWALEIFPAWIFSGLEPI